MTQETLAMTTLVVPDYDSAIRFYTQTLGFILIEDADLGAGKRWVVVEAAGGGRLLLAKASNAQQSAAIGNQAGVRVGFFLNTDNFEDCHQRFLSNGVKFIEAPRQEAYGMVAVFSDPFGNQWDLIEVKDKND